MSDLDLEYVCVCVCVYLVYIMNLHVLILTGRKMGGKLLGAKRCLEARQKGERLNTAHACLLLNTAHACLLLLFQGSIGP